MPIYPITTETVGDFMDRTTNDICKLKEFNYQHIIDRINMIEMKRDSQMAISNEKNENLLYRLTILTEKCNSVEQKVNDLNKIMMKHFAYKTNKSDSETVTKNKINLPLPPTPLIPTTQPFKFT
jgi:hypothetical protein